ncbi:MAG: hypothetical protein II926_07275 [Bacteroidales bacterium]|nr:hypothetical protein [Bacteroidales bacterium]
MLNKITKHLFPDSKEWAWEQYILLCVKGSATGLLDNKLVTLNPMMFCIKQRLHSFPLHQFRTMLNLS